MTFGYLVLGTFDFHSYSRTIGVSLGRRPAIDLERRTPQGVPCGLIRLHHDALDVLGRALAAVRVGTTGVVGTVPISKGAALSIHVPDAHALAILRVDMRGETAGRATVLRGDELERLAEAYCIAMHEVAA